MQESSGTLQEKFSVLMCGKGLVLHRERSPSDLRLDTCTGSPKGARLVPREIDLLKKRLLPLSVFFFFFPPLLHTHTNLPSLLSSFCGKKNTWINDCLLHWRLMIRWRLSVLALKVEKSFDDGGLRLTDKSRTPPPSAPLRHTHAHTPLHRHITCAHPSDAPHLSCYLVMCSTVIAMATHCYFISSLP